MDHPQAWFFAMKTYVKIRIIIKIFMATLVFRKIKVHYDKHNC
jgi:hypothetical protein